jgi:acylphosphatase
LDSTVEQREVYFSGRVQGVGFRYTARHIAARFPVEGFVRNLPDGRVLLVAEGTGEALDAYLSTLEAEMGRYIESKAAAVRPATGEFNGFVVRH